MSHEVQKMAFINEVPWHGLGTQLEENQPIEVWKEAAGLNWEAKNSQVFFKVGEEIKESKPHRLLYRGDTELPLGIVSNRYKVVQPGAVLEFFADLVSVGGIKLETAGCLRGGKKVWALANTGESFSLDGDEVKRYILFATSYDLSLLTLAKHTSVRVVCNNTLGMAVDGGGDRVTIRHTSSYNRDEVRNMLGLDKGWLTFKENVQKLSSMKVDDNTALKFFANIYYKSTASEISLDELMARPFVMKRLEQLMNAYQFGPGQDLPSAKGTAWGMVNAVTYAQDHLIKERVSGSRLDSAWFGSGAQVKELAFDEALKLAA